LESVKLYWCKTICTISLTFFFAGVTFDGVNTLLELELESEFPLSEVYINDHQINRYSELTKW